MSRITVQVVEQAFSATGFVPGRTWAFKTLADGRTAACALTAIMAALIEAKLPPPDLWHSLSSVTLGYVSGFVKGWDGCRSADCDDPLGVEDGRKCWAALKHLAV